MSNASETSTHWDNLHTAVVDRIELGTRTLAIFRVGLGFLLLADLLLRSRNLVTFYSDRGLLPVTTLAEMFPAYRLLSLHALWGSVAFQAILFLLAALAAMALVVGYRTRTATILSLVLLVSLQARNPMVLNSGDLLLRRLLFWSVFLPLGSQLSVDVQHNGSRRGTVASVASAGLLFQIVFVYLANLGFKLQGTAWPSGNAVEQVLTVDAFSFLLGDVLREFPALLTGVSWVWLILLACSPLLILTTGRPRALLATAFATVHVGMGLTMQIGLFPAISVVALVPFLGAVFDDIVRPAALRRPLHRLASTLPSFPHVAVPERIRRVGGRIQASVLVAVLVGLVLLNAMALGYVSPPAGTPDAVTERSWDMFGPTPPQYDVGITAIGALSSGKTVHILAETGIRRGRLASPQYATARWHKYLTNVRGAPEVARRTLATYLCTRWNESHDDEMVSVTISATLTPAPDDSLAASRRLDYGTFDCAVR